MTYIFIFISLIIVFYQWKRERRWVNLLSLLIVPYIVIVVVNNLIIYRFGFYEINNNVLIMLSCAFIVIFLGTLPFKFPIANHSEQNNKEILKSYNFKAVKIFLYIVGVLGLSKALILYRQGILFNADNDFEGIMGTGPIAHLLLASYSVLPIYFLNWTYNRKLKDIIPVILILLVAFSTMIKYNTIGPIISLFIFVCIYRKSIFKKAITGFAIIILFVFIANYAIGFALLGVEVESTFYLVHFWKYFAGSLINDNYIFSSGINVGVGIFDKFMIFIFALPNMFINKISGMTFYPYDMLSWHDYPVSDFGEMSNVTDVFGFLYPSKGDFSEIILFMIAIFIVSILFSYFYTKVISKQNTFCPFIAIMLTYFVALDFYSPFFVLAGPWEILMWALIIPSLFRVRDKSTVLIAI